MIWVVFAVLSHFFWAWVNIGEKYLVEKKFKNPFVYLVVAFWVGPIVLIGLPFVDFYLPSSIVLLEIFSAAFLFVIGCSFYIKAIQVEEVSRINILWNLIPFFNLVLGWFLIGEKLTIIEFLAFVILISASLVASVHFNKGKMKISKAFVLMIFACLFISMCDVFLKIATKDISFSLAFIYLSIFTTLISFVYFFSPKFRLDFYEQKKSLSLKLIFLVIGVNILSKIGLLFSIWSLSLGPIALVTSLEGLQVIFVFIIIILFSIFAPKVLREELDRKNIMLKLLAMLLMICGILVLAFA